MGVCGRGLGEREGGGSGGRELVGWGGLAGGGRMRSDARAPVDGAHGLALPRHIVGDIVLCVRVFGGGMGGDWGGRKQRVMARGSAARVSSWCWPLSAPASAPHHPMQQQSARTCFPASRASSSVAACACAGVCVCVWGRGSGRKGGGEGSRTPGEWLGQRPPLPAAPSHYRHHSTAQRSENHAHRRRLGGGAVARPRRCAREVAAIHRVNQRLAKVLAGVWVWVGWGGCVVWVGGAQGVGVRACVEKRASAGACRLAQPTCALPKLPTLV